jgi:hypothetical protein
MMPEQYFSELKRYRELADADYLTMDVNEFETKWLSSKTSPIAAALRLEQFAEIKPVSRIFFKDHLVGYVQESIRVHRLIIALCREHKN